MEGVLQRKLKLRLQTTWMRKRIWVLAKSHCHGQLVHLVLDHYPLILPRPGIRLVCNKVQEDLKCMRDLKNATMQMFCSHHLLLVCTRVKERRKGTVQVSNGEASRRSTPHRGVLLFSKPLHGVWCWGWYIISVVVGWVPWLSICKHWQFACQAANHSWLCFCCSWYGEKNMIDWTIILVLLKSTRPSLNSLFHFVQR